MADNQLKQQILIEIASGATPQQCAEKYSIPAGTIRSWLSRAKAKGETQPKPQQDDATQRSKKKDAMQRTNATKKKATGKAKEPVIKLEDVDEELTEKQRLFCLIYTRDPVAGTAAKKAGFSEKCSYEIGYQLLQNPSVRKEIERLKKIKAQSILFGVEDLVEKHMRIAFSNMTDFAEFGRIEVPVMGPFGPIKIKETAVDPETGKKKKVERVLTRIVNDVRFRESNEVDGGIIHEVKLGRDGASIKLYDAQKSMDWLERYFEHNPTDKHKKWFDEERLKIEQEKLKLAQQKAGDDGGEETTDDGFINALNSEASSVWSDKDED